MMKFYLILFFSFFYSLTYSQRFDKVVIKSTHVHGSVYMLEGAGGNIGLAIGDSSVLMIDSQFGELSDRILNEIRTISDKPIQYLVNTHWHGDHTGGNENFNTHQTTIVAHENVRKRLSTDQFTKAFNRTSPAKPSSYWPEVSYSEELSLFLNPSKILIMHVDSAHTDGDSFVFFPEDNVLHLGDCFFNKRFPYIDLSAGGSIQGLIKAVQTALMVADEDSFIIPGHGALATRDDLLEYYTVIRGMFEAIEDAMQRGVSLDELKQAELDKGIESWGEGFISTAKFIDTIWTDLDRRK